jgi:NAD(P)-dependent dehydrogenase (short-subunit alcohol dehydrogenase family)
MSRSVLVTGGTGSVGAHLVRGLCSRDFDVSFTFNKGESEAGLLSAATGAKSIQCDLSSPLAISSLSGDWDCLVNNAAVNVTSGYAAEVAVDDWDLTFAVNARAPFLLIQRCLPYMLGQSWGRIVNVSSIYGYRAVEGNVSYTASKHALHGLSNTVAREYARHGVTCNLVCPGPIESNLMERVAARETDGSGEAIRLYLKETADGVPAGRMAHTSDIEAAVLFLISEQAQYINGVALPVDGALTTV